MTQRTRGSQWWALAVVAGLGVHGEASARQNAGQAESAAKPVVRAAARNPPGAAKSLAALARFANGQLGDTPHDKRIAAALGKLQNAKATARRIVGPYEAMSPGERGQIFVGVADLEKLTTRTYDRPTTDKIREADAAKVGPLAAKTILVPDVPAGKGSYAISYRGMTVHKGADADGTDEPVVFTSVFWAGSVDEPYKSMTRTLPDSGTLGVANGASSGASAGDVWSSSWWPGSSLLLLSAVLEDNGDLAQRKEDINLLIALALSEAAESAGPDRMAVLRGELEDTLELLHLANHQAWDSKTIQLRQLSSYDYDQLYEQAPVATPFAHRLTMHHNPRGADYTLYFDVPVPQVTWRTVSITIKQIEALGPGRDRAQNQVADFGADVAIDGHTTASASRAFGSNKNVLKPGWTVERQVQAGSNVKLNLMVWDRDPPPKTGCLDWECAAYCADAPDARDAVYGGRCPPRQVAYDINERPESVTGWCTSCTDFATTIAAVFDLGSNTLSGDIHGPAGTYTLTGTPGAANQARVIVEISQK